MSGYISLETLYAALDVIDRQAIKGEERNVKCITNRIRSIRFRDEARQEMINKITAVNIVHNVIAEHFHGEWNEEEQAEVFSAWDKELLTINKEICKRIREEVEE